MKTAWHRNGDTLSFDAPTTAGAYGHDYRDLFDDAPSGYMLLGEKGCIELINRSGAAMLGWAPEWLAGKRFSRWVANNDRPLLHAHLQRLRDGERGISQELHVRNRHGRFISLKLISRGAAAGFRCIMIDTSDQELSARRLRRLQAQLAHLTRLHTAGELATSLAHELNQPLGTVVLNCQAALRLLEGGAGDEYEFAEVLAQTAEAASYASEIIRNLRGFLRRNGELHRVCDLARIVRDVVMLVEADARDNDIGIALDIVADLPDVHADPIQIEQVLVNLVHNAIEAIAENPGGKSHRIAIRARAAGRDRIQVEIEDTGPGLSAGDIAQLFNPFYTTKPDGMGMGLSISRNIIEAHGGELDADSGSDGGALFRFTLPRLDPAHDDA